MVIRGAPPSCDMARHGRGLNSSIWAAVVDDVWSRLSFDMQLEERARMPRHHDGLVTAARGAASVHDGLLVLSKFQLRHPCLAPSPRNSNVDPTLHD